MVTIDAPLQADLEGFCRPETIANKLDFEITS